MGIAVHRAAVVIDFLKRGVPMRKEAFCIDCGDVNGFRIKWRKRELEHQGVRFFAEEECAVCEKCGGEVFVREIQEENSRRQWSAYADACELENAKQRS